MLKKLLPASTSPATKFIRTLEGAVVIVFNAAIILDATLGSLPQTQGAKWLAVFNTAALIARSALKAVLAANPAAAAVQQKAAPLETDLVALAPQVAGQIQQLIKDGKLKPADLLGDLAADVPADKPAVEHLVDDATEMVSAPPDLPESATRPDVQPPIPGRSLQPEVPQPPQPPQPSAQA